MTAINNRTSVPTNTTSTPTHAQFDQILLDKSSSMHHKWDETIRAIDTYIASLQAARVNTTLRLTAFHHNPEEIVGEGPVGDWGSIRGAVSPDGSTHLYDAIVKMGATLRDLDPVRCSIVIVTDGEDSVSKLPIETARAVLDWCRAKGWQVTFIGADFNNNAQAKALGADENSAIGVSKARLTDAAKSLGEKRKNYGLYGSPMGFNDDEKSQFGGYLNGPAS